MVWSLPHPPAGPSRLAVTPHVVWRSPHPPPACLTDCAVTPRNISSDPPCGGPQTVWVADPTPQVSVGLRPPVHYAIGWLTMNENIMSVGVGRDPSIGCPLWRVPPCRVRFDYHPPIGCGSTTAPIWCGCTHLPPAQFLGNSFW